MTDPVQTRAGKVRTDETDGDRAPEQAKLPKIAVAYYSKSGHTQAIAERLALTLDADMFALRTPRYRMPFFGYLRAGMDSLRRTSSPLEHPLPDLTSYDAAIICGPVWTSYPAAPICSYLRQAKQLPHVLGLMLTCGDHSPPEKAFAVAEQELGRKFRAKAAIANSIEDKPEAQKRINDLIETLLQSMAVQTR